MSDDTQPEILCEPEELNFNRIPLFGESVFRLKCHPRDSPTLLLLGKNEEWRRWVMVNEDLDTFYVAFRLEPGTYYYQFLVAGAPVLDPQNPSELAVRQGRLANVLRVRDHGCTISLRNAGTSLVPILFQALPPVLTFDPQELLVPPQATAHVVVRPTADQVPSLPEQRVDVQLRHPLTGKVFCGLSAMVSAHTTVPSLTFPNDLRMLTNTFKLDMRARGNGSIRCHIIDRLTPAVDSFQLCCGREYGFAGKIYRSGSYHSSLPEVLVDMPAVLVLSDSPFVEQRLVEFSAVGTGNRSAK